jgi:polyphosphate kinase 2 (PPK2 family)
VLVERVEKLLPENGCRLAYDDIVAFERQLLDGGYVLAKFWLHVSEEEQKRRLEKMANDPFESWKVKPENWRNNNRYKRYVEATEEMFLRTSNPMAPWTVVESNSKYYSRLKVIETFIETVTPALDGLDLKKS